MKWVWRISAFVWLFFYIMGWVVPATVESIGNIARNGLLALVLITWHFGFDHK